MSLGAVVELPGCIIDNRERVCLGDALDYENRESHCKTN